MNALNIDIVIIYWFIFLCRDEHYMQEFLKNLVGRTAGLIVTHPLDVICVRMMAQFVGRETKYVLVIKIKFCSIINFNLTTCFSFFYLNCICTNCQNILFSVHF
jgi:short subunit fatty acids transporter